MEKPHLVEVAGRYEGGLRVTAVHGPSGATLRTDAPRDNHGRGEGFSPTDLVGTALGTCVCTILGIVAQQRGLDLSSMRFRTTKRMVADPVRRIGRLETTIHLPSSLGPEHREALERAAQSCPVRASLHPKVEAPLEFRYDADGAA